MGAEARPAPGEADAAIAGRAPKRRHYGVGTACIVAMTLVWVALSEILTKVQTEHGASLLHAHWCAARAARGPVRRAMSTASLRRAG